MPTPSTEALVADLDRVGQDALAYFEGPGRGTEARVDRWRARDVLMHESVDELLTQLRGAHARLVRAARSAPDLDRPCFQRATGELMSGRQRLELLARHWAAHVKELQAAATAAPPGGRSG